MRRPPDAGHRIRHSSIRRPLWFFAPASSGALSLKRLDGALQRGASLPRLSIFLPFPLCKLYPEQTTLPQLGNRRRPAAFLNPHPLSLLLFNQVLIPNSGTNPYFNCFMDLDSHL